MKAISLFLLIALASCTRSTPTRTAAPTKTPAHPYSKYQLTDQNERSYSLSPSDRFTFVSFVFTRCPQPKMCPLTMTLTKRVQRLWKENAIKTPVKFLIVTLDPNYDTPKVLKEFAKSYRLDNNYTLVTGNHDILTEFASEFNVVGLPNEVGIISHNMKSILLSPTLEEIKQYKDNEWKADQVIQDVKQHQNVGTQPEKLG